MKRRTLVFGLTSLVAVGLVFFQNCSGVHFSSSGADLQSLALSAPLQVGESQVKVSAQQVPNLKLFFVVDNSYTMKANQVNLGQSFAQMFSANENSSLVRFDTTAYLISTAQKAQPLGSNQLRAVTAAQLGADAVKALSFANLSSFRAGAVNPGAVPGDDVGFSALLSPDGKTASFLPAVVLGGDGAGGVGTGIHKAMGDPSDSLAAEFQRRLAVINTDHQPTNSDGSYVYEDIVDNESGLCATARILRNSDAFVKSGEQAAFVIVSDEDENDPAGKNCVQTFQSIQPTDDLVRGTCETRQTTLTYAVPGKAADQCSVKFQTGYQVSYAYPVATTSTAITYRQLASAGAWSSPQTTVSFSTKSTSFTQTFTNVSYFTKTCTPIMHDGVQSGQNCTYPSKSLQVNGNKTAGCAAAASSDPSAVTNDPAHAPSCTLGTKAVSSCASGDDSCVAKVSFTPAAQVVDGTIATGDACVAKAKGFANAVTDGSQPVTCAAAAARTGSGACPSNLASLGCASTSGPSYRSNTVMVSGDFSAAADCQAKAAQQPGAAVDASNVASCAKSSGTSNKTWTGTIPLVNSGDGGSSVAVGSCGAVQPAVVAAAQKADASAPSTGTCSVTGFTTSTGSAAAADGACDQTAVAQVCAQSSGLKRQCAGQFVAGGATSTPSTMPPVSRDISCNDLCSASNDVLCSPAGGVTPTDTMTIAQYLVARYGAGTTCAVAKSAQTVSNFVDHLASDQASLCKGSAAVPQYAVVSAPYRAAAHVTTDWVAGSSADGSAPASSLGDFITTRSQSLFAVTQPIVSVLVRTPGDPTGDGGSTGTEYSRVATAMGGRADSVLSSDYSGSLKALSGIIQDRLQRSFVISDMQPSQTVQQVMLLRANTGQWITLQPGEWTAVGNDVTIAKTVSYSPDDYLRFRYY